MKAKQQHTLWINTAYSAVMGLLIAGIILIRRDLPTTILALLIATYVIGNIYIHIRRGDFTRESLYEYVLVAIAVFIVLASAVLH